MHESLDKAIDLLAGKITNSVREDQALKYTQAALNLAHTKATLVELQESKKRNSKGADA